VILVDTSVWVTHFRSGSRRLEQLLLEGLVRCHPFVIGELACGSLRQRQRVLAYLDALPPATVAGNAEVRGLVEARALHGMGLGWTDVHLIASALIDGDEIWTLDRRFARASRSLGLAG
jgi:predicted nucleic acid-binding protein